jgi:hypothetical protein
MSSKPSHLNEALKPRLYLSSILIFQPLWRRVWSPVLAPPRHHLTESSLLGHTVSTTTSNCAQKKDVIA